MERRGREGMWEEGDGTCCTSKWLCFCKCAAQSLVTRLTKLEGFLCLWGTAWMGLIFPLAQFKGDHMKEIAAHTYRWAQHEGTRQLSVHQRTSKWSQQTKKRTCHHCTVPVEINTWINFGDLLPWGQILTAYLQMGTQHVNHVLLQLQIIDTNGSNFPSFHNNDITHNTQMATITS